MVAKIAIILLVNLLFYMKTIKFGYVSDDLDYIKNHKHSTKPWHYWLERLTFGKKVAWVDHSLQVFYHASTCAFIYLGFGATNVSFLAALLFSFNPANSQASIWLSGRGYLLPLLCLLVAMACPIISPVMIYLLVWFTAGFLAPLALLGSPYEYLILLAPIAWFLHAKRFHKTVDSKIKAEGFVEDAKFSLSKIVIAIKTFGFYLTLAIIPFKIAFYHSFLQSCSGSWKKQAYTMKDKFFWIGLVAIIGFLVYSSLHWDLISWGFLWFMICIAPFCNLRRLNQEIAERYIYLPNAGLMFALAGLIIHYPIVITVFLTMYVVRMWNVLEMYKDDYWIVEYSNLEDKAAWYGWHIKALKRWDNKSFREALIFWVMAKMISPKEFKIRINLATILKLLKNEKECEENLKVAQDNIVPGQEEQAMRLIQEVRDGKGPILI